jgi:hypothetical protein
MGLRRPSISNAGSVAWYAGRPTGENTYMRGNGDGPFETVYTAGQFGIGSLDDSPVVDSSGTLAFMSHTASGQAIFLGDGGPPITFADTAGPFRSFAGYQGYDSPALNDRGTVVFYAELDDGRAGIFVGPDAAEDAVIRTGDALFGSVVTNLRYFKALSDNDDIAFNYTLENGLTGIAVTRVPEPSGAAIALVGALSVLSRRRRAKR